MSIFPSFDVYLCKALIGVEVSFVFVQTSVGLLCSCSTKENRSQNGVVGIYSI